MDQPRRALLETVAESAPAARGSSRALGPIELRHLSKRFGATSAVEDLSVTIAPGRVTGFLGPNGAGKTTTLRMLVGLIRPSSGTATFGGVAYADLDAPQRRVGCVLEPVAHPSRSGRDHLRVLAATADADRTRVDELLELVGLAAAARRSSGTYSLGMRQRLALAGALLGNPDYLVLDEPANGLDPEGIRWLRAFLRSFAASGRTVLVSSHVLAEVQATADDVVVIGGGRLLRQVSMAEAIGGGTALRVRVRRAEGARALLVEHDLEVVLGRDQHGPFLTVSSDEPATVGQLLFDAGFAVHELSRETQDLEQQFFALVESAASSQGTP